MAAHRRPTNKVGLYFRLGLSDAQPLGHLVVEKSLARHIRLHPLAIDHKLRDGTLAGVLDHFFHRARRGLDVDIVVGDGFAWPESALPRGNRDTKPQSKR